VRIIIGFGAGATMREAVLSGLCGCIAADALAWWRLGDEDERDDSEAGEERRESQRQLRSPPGGTRVEKGGVTEPWVGCWPRR
jgi:hypothetical protein